MVRKLILIILSNIILLSCSDNYIGKNVNSKYHYDGNSYTYNSGVHTPQVSSFALEEVQVLSGNNGGRYAGGIGGAINPNASNSIAQNIELTPRNKERVEKSKIINPRMMIYDAYINLSTNEEPDSLTLKLTNLSTKLDGFLLSTSKFSINIRIPNEHLQNFIENLKEFGKIESKNIETKDVSEQFSDLKIKLENIEKSRDRYLELLKKAENVETALKVERELERLLIESESIKGHLQRISHLVEFSTITIYYSKPVKPGPVVWIFKGAYEVIKWLFVWD